MNGSVSPGTDCCITDPTSCEWRKNLKHNNKVMTIGMCSRKARKMDGLTTKPRGHSYVIDSRLRHVYTSR